MPDLPPGLDPNEAVRRSKELEVELFMEIAREVIKSLEAWSEKSETFKEMLKLSESGDRFQIIGMMLAVATPRMIMTLPTHDPQVRKQAMRVLKMMATQSEMEL